MEEWCGMKYVDHENDICINCTQCKNVTMEVFQIAASIFNAFYQGRRIEEKKNRRRKETHR